MRSFPASNISLFLALMTSANAGQNPWGGGSSGGIGGLMPQAMGWWVEKCNAPNVGYDQDYRNEQTINGITYYDCSSFVWYGLGHAGFEINLSAWPFTTYTMGSTLKQLGFKEIIINDFSTFEFQTGDILVVNSSQHQHTEIVHDTENGGHTMGAHGKSGRPLADQVSINTYPIQSGLVYTHCYRFPFSGGNWIAGGSGEYFGDPTAELCGNNPKAINNANTIKAYFLAQGWSVNAIAGLCGNIQQESTFNPNLIEVGGTGHGLVQWTPPTDLYHVLDVLYGSHDDWYDGQKQVSVIFAEFQQSSGIKNWGIEPQWYSTGAYPLSWKKWSTSTQDAGYLALAFQANYERPASIHQERAGYARAWYKYFTEGE